MRSSLSEKECITIHLELAFTWTLHISQIEVSLSPPSSLAALKDEWSNFNFAWPSHFTVILRCNEVLYRFQSAQFL